MILKLYSIYDSKAEVFGPVTPARHDNEMLREFARHANDPGSRIGQHPEDYSLFCVGDFDDSKGELNKCLPKNMGLAASLVRGAEVTQGRPMARAVPEEVTVE